MGCFRNRCGGYELAANLDFDTNGSGDADAGDTYRDDGDGWERIGDIVSPFEAALEGDGRTIPTCISTGRIPAASGCSGRPAGTGLFAMCA